MRTPRALSIIIIATSLASVAATGSAEGVGAPHAAPTARVDLRLQGDSKANRGDFVALDLTIDADSLSLDLSVVVTHDGSRTRFVSSRFGTGFSKGEVETETTNERVILNSTRKLTSSGRIATLYFQIDREATLGVTSFGLAGSGEQDPRIGLGAPADLEIIDVPRLVPAFNPHPGIKHFDVIHDYRHSNAHGGSRWTPERMLELMQEYPDKYISVGPWGSRPPGNTAWLEVGSVVNQLQALGAKQGVDTSRIVIGLRPDVDAPMRDGHPICGNHCGWEGNRTGDPFNPDWMMKVPRAQHDEIIARFWYDDPHRDPFALCNNEPVGRIPSPADNPDSNSSNPVPSMNNECWGVIDRESVLLGVNSEEVVALYGGAASGSPLRKIGSLPGDERPYLSGVLLDMRNSEYRQWSARRLIYKLEDMGIDPGEPAMVNLAYKPGQYNYREKDTDNGNKCWVRGSHAWVYPAHVCFDPSSQTYSASGAANLHYSQFTRGEFQATLNAMIFEYRRALDRHGYSNVVISTAEGPPYGANKTNTEADWSLLSPWTTRQPWLIGDVGWCSISCNLKHGRCAPMPSFCRSR